MKIQIRHRFLGKVLFELKKENNSIKITLEAAIKAGADLSGADLSGANLCKADLSGADLSGADLSGADLSGANLYRADLYRADLSGADLYGADLCKADLSGADLSGADLSGANLYRADLSGADLSGADLSGANLYRADLSGIKTPPINSHQFTSEILYRESKTEPQKDFAARVRLETDQCWSFFYGLAKNKKVILWVKKVLGKWDAYKEKMTELEKNP